MGRKQDRRLGDGGTLDTKRSATSSKTAGSGDTYNSGFMVVDVHRNKFPMTSLLQSVAEQIRLVGVMGIVVVRERVKAEDRTRSCKVLVACVSQGDMELTGR